MRTVADWQKRRKQIIEGMEQAMGTLPDRSKLDPPTMEVLEEVKEPKFTRLSVKIAVDPAYSVPAWLYLPTGRPAGTRSAAVLALHQTESIGKQEVDGGSPKYPDQRHGRELAERGYVVLAPDYPTFGDYPCDFSDKRFASGSILGVFNHMRCIDLLVARDDVDPGRIGAIGHSLGGHNAMFLAAFDERVKATVSSCGWTPFHDYIPGKFSNWGQDQIMPRVRSQFGSDPDRMPFDFYEVVAAFAPRAFLSISPLHDANFDVAGVRKAIPARRRSLSTCCRPAITLQVRYPDVGHSFPETERSAAYAFLRPASELIIRRMLPTISRPNCPAFAARAERSIEIVFGRCRAFASSKRRPSRWSIRRWPPRLTKMARCSWSRWLTIPNRTRTFSARSASWKIPTATDASIAAPSLPTISPGRRRSFAPDGGVFIAAAPDILYCKDTDGDGKADLAEGGVYRLRPQQRAGTAQQLSMGTRQSHLRCNQYVGGHRPPARRGGRGRQFERPRFFVRSESARPASRKRRGTART